MKQRVKQLEQKMRQGKDELLFIEHKGRIRCGGVEYTAEEVRQIAERQPVFVLNIDIPGLDDEAN
ncbi:MAG: hypothetical protein ACTSXZ_03065 [Alphaproteobacteria bacterium]